MSKDSRDTANRIVSGIAVSLFATSLATGSKEMLKDSKSAAEDAYDSMKMTETIKEVEKQRDSTTTGGK